MIKLPVSIFGQTTGYRIYTVSERANEITSNSISSVWYLIKMNLLQKNVWTNLAIWIYKNIQRMKTSPYVVRHA